MRITYLAAGAGDTYCGACARDAVLVRALLKAGHEVHMIPLYTPLKLEDDALPLEPVFFGGINMFLQQAFGLFRHLPMVLDRFLDRPAFLRWISRFSIQVDPRKLGPMTVSVLAGRNGRQRKEVDRLLAYLAKGPRPEIINLTNSLLSALAPEIKRRLGVPVVCTFQGEDQFVRDLAEPYSSQARELIRSNAKSVDLFICPNEAMLAEVADFLGVPPHRLRVVRTAVEIEPPKPHTSEIFTIGYLSAIRPAKGLDILLEAVALLVRERRATLRLLVAGRIADDKFWQSIQQSIKRLGLETVFEFLGEVDGPGKTDFFHRCSVLALPSRYAEPRGVAALEAMAAGVPAIVPVTGVFPEILKLGGGGVLMGDHEPAHWADAIEKLIQDPVQVRELGAQARACIAAHCSPQEMVAKTLEQYASLLAPARLTSPPA